MRAVLVIGLLGCVACTTQGSDDPATHDPDHSDRCGQDPPCGEGLVCSQPSECLAPERIYAIHINWTLSGRPANKTTCAGLPDFSVYFSSDGSAPKLSYSPVPCAAGRFTIDRVSRIVNEASLLAPGVAEYQRAKLDPVTGEGLIDLPL